MKKNSAKIIIISIIIIIFTIIVAGILFIYTKTDFLKSNKELFFKYAEQIVKTEEGFIDKELIEYMDKKKENKYINEGEFSLNISSDNNSEQYKNVNNFNISFSGQTDIVNKNSTQNISLNYSDSVKFPINYKKVNNVIGLQTDYVGSKFLALRIDDINEITNSENENLNIAPETISEIQEFKLTEQEKEHIKNTYLKIINENLKEENFSKLETSGTKGYKVNLKGAQLKNILVKLLDTFKNDQIILNKISEINSEDIDEIIEEVNNSTDIEEKEFEISIFETNGMVNEIIFKNNDIAINIKKQKKENEINYNIVLELLEEQELSKIQFNIKYTGLIVKQNISENYEVLFDIESGENYKYSFDNNISFKEEMDIEEFNSENSIILTDYESEQVGAFIQAVWQRIIDVNKQQMEELGIQENENPILQLIPALGIYSSAADAIEINGMKEAEITAFNSKFEMYQSSNLQGVTVKGLLSEIFYNNKNMEKDRQITEINYNGEEYQATESNIEIIKNNIEKEASYRVEFEKDSETGIIYRAVINKK